MKIFFGVKIMKITDEAKSFIQGVMAENNVNGIKVIFAGMG